MEIDKNKLQALAHLARLNIKPEEEDGLLADMTEILQWVNHLKTVDTKGVEPLRHMTLEENVLREDKAEDHQPQEQLLKNAPDTHEKYFKVPQVLKPNK